jgi:hypothetical protein
VRGADGEQLIAHAHRFIRLDVDGEVIGNAEIDVTEISLNEADLVRGIDFLASRRGWISYGSQLLFLISIAPKVTPQGRGGPIAPETTTFSSGPRSNGPNLPIGQPIGKIA